MRKSVIWTGTLAAGLLPAFWSGSGFVVPSEKGQAMTVVDESEKLDVAKRVSAISAETAELISRPGTTVDRMPTPFFSHGVIYLVTFTAPSGPMAFTVGYANSDAPIMLQNNPNGFFELAEKAHTSLVSENLKIAYGSTFLECTRDFRKRFQVLQQASDIQLIANPSAEEQAQYNGLQEKYKAVIRAPQLSATPSPELKLFALVGQDLTQIILTFGEHGHLKRSDKVLEKALPIAFAK